MSTTKVVPRILELICERYDGSEGFLERTDDAQLWYNRGYTNGVIHTPGDPGYGRQVAVSLDPDAEDLISRQEGFPWGRAYGHGWEMGKKEAREVMEVD